MLALQKKLEEGQDEQAEDLKDQLEVGRLALKKIDEENRRVTQQVEEMRVKSKKEEGARYAAAFYNSLNMVILQQQKAQLEVSIDEMEEHLHKEQAETEKLKEELSATEEVAATHMRAIEKLKKDDNEHHMMDMQMQDYHEQLKQESAATHKKAEREIELRYAQKLVNIHKLKKTRDAHSAELAAQQEELDDKLSRVILEAAEQYEAQVRQYADAETAICSRASAAEKDIDEFVRRREVAEARCTELHTEIRQREKAHARKMEEIEEKWKNVYNAMREEHEKRLTKLEEQTYEEQRTWDSQDDEMQSEMEHDETLEVSKKETAIRIEDARWASRVAKAQQAQNEKLDKTIKQASEQNAQHVAARRNELERRSLHYSFITDSLSTTPKKSTYACCRPKKRWATLVACTTR